MEEFEGSEGYTLPKTFILDNNILFSSIARAFNSPFKTNNYNVCFEDYGSKFPEGFIGHTNITLVFNNESKFDIKKNSKYCVLVKSDISFTRSWSISFYLDEVPSKSIPTGMGTVAIRSYATPLIQDVIINMFLLFVVYTSFVLLILRIKKFIKEGD